LTERLFELRERRRLQGLKVDAIGRAPTLVELDQNLEQFDQPLRGDGEAPLIIDPDRSNSSRSPAKRVQAAGTLRAVEQVEHGRQQVDAPPVDLDAELEPEPVEPLVVVDVRVPRRLTLDDLVGVIAVDLDPKAERTKLRDGVRRERAKAVDVAVHLNEVVRL